MKKTIDPDGTVASGTVKICGNPVSVLFDTDATHSFMSLECVKRLGMGNMFPYEPFVMKLPNGDHIIGDHEVRDCRIEIGGVEWSSDFITRDLKDEDIILGDD